MSSDPTLPFILVGIKVQLGLGRRFGGWVNKTYSSTAVGGGIYLSVPTALAKCGSVWSNTVKEI